MTKIAAANPGQVSGRSFATTIVVAVVASAGLLVALRYLLGDWLRAGIGVAWFVALFFSYGLLDIAIARPTARPSPGATALDWLGDRFRILHSTTWVALLAIGWLWLRWRAHLPPRLSSALNLVSVLLIITWYLVSRQWWRRGSSTMVVLPVAFVLFTGLALAIRTARVAITRDGIRWGWTSLGFA